MWLALQMTGSPAIAGVVLALEGIPKLLGPLAGAILDRANKRWLMIGTDLIRGVILIAVFGLQLLGWLQIWHLYILVVILGASSVIYDPALRVILPTLVPDKTLSKANSFLQGSLQISMIAGTTLAGIALAAFGAPIALLLDGVSFLGLALALWFIRFPPALLQSTDIKASQVLRDMFAGLHFIIITQEVLMLTFIAFFINLVLSITAQSQTTFHSRAAPQGCSAIAQRKSGSADWETDKRIGERTGQWHFSDSGSSAYPLCRRPSADNLCAH